jgi:hypothetical protein
MTIPLDLATNQQAYTAQIIDRLGDINNALMNRSKFQNIGIPSGQNSTPTNLSTSAQYTTTITKNDTEFTNAIGVQNGIQIVGYGATGDIAVPGTAYLASANIGTLTVNGSPLTSADSIVMAIALG